jgi:hypothetical protein
MSIFGTIKDAIFGSAAAAPAPAPAPAEAAAPPPPPAPPPATLSEDQIYAVLEKHAEARGEPLNYKESIVDLMKAIGQDSSLDARKQLATELGYTGDQSDTATMNIWLHQKTMDKLMNG